MSPTGGVYDERRLGLAIDLRGCGCLDDGGQLCKDCHVAYERLEQYEGVATTKLAEQACRIARHQQNGRLHPLTCGVDSTHAPLIPAVKDGRVVLRCLGPMTGLTPSPCAYEQELPGLFAHSVHKDGSR